MLAGTTTTMTQSLMLLVSILSLSTSNGVHGLTYENDWKDPTVTTLTRHTKLQKRTHVDMDDLELSDLDAKEAAHLVMSRIGSRVEDRLTKLFAKATTQECRTKIAHHFGYFINAMGTERSLPFADIQFPNQCPSPPAYDVDRPDPALHLGILQNKTYQPVDGNYKQPQDLRFCYGIMTHEHARDTIRLIQALYEPGHTFIIHVDAKETSDHTHNLLHQYAKDKPYIHILDHPYRVRVNWGGFSMVNATLQMLHYSFENNLDYDKFVHLASSNYPLASNAKIRNDIAKYPLDANLMYIVLKPSRPSPGAWHYFVECDDAVHRIYRLPPLINATSRVELYTSSQWFTLSREFAHYLAYPQPGTFVYEFLPYAQHVVVADETFFGTVLLHSPYCDQHANWNGVHLQFDQWENQIPIEQRDAKKCIMPDPNHCGRSPTTITMDYVDLLTLSDDLFARKFATEDDEYDEYDNDDERPLTVKDVLDQHRNEQQKLYNEQWHNNNNSDAVVSGDISMPNKVNTTFEGYGVLIVAKATVSSKMPLCLGLGPTGNYAKLLPCFFDIIPPSLADGWETGAVILEETPLHNRWKLGPCTPDGNLERLHSAEIKMTPGNYSPAGPRCMLTQMDGIREGRCLDAHSNGIEPGGKARVFPCIKRWPQFFSFGNGTLAPKGSMHTNVPQHIVDRIRESRPEEPPQEAYLCLGVLGRGDMDEEHLYEVDGPEKEAAAADADEDTDKKKQDTDLEVEEYDSDGFLKLDHFQDQEIVATRCSNVGAVIEWLFVPYIQEDDLVILENEMDSSDKPGAAAGAEINPTPPTCSTESCYEEE